MTRREEDCDNYQNLRKALTGSLQGISICEKMEVLHLCLKCCGRIPAACRHDRAPRPGSGEQQGEPRFNG